eukprot:TRINITY_DN1087_c0_g4_i1.p1 TRINITY_DN1087_c0_g4~~TRINITY_DN1087_c0_g4_i1.p1  ORF type:complete len:610 (-),score=107.04 TRINITY_DN1087_c0_g4_i1:171-1967(-)
MKPRNTPAEMGNSPIPYRTAINKHKDDIHFQKMLEKTNVRDLDQLFSSHTPNDPNLRSKALHQIPSSFMPISSLTQKSLDRRGSDIFSCISPSVSMTGRGPIHGMGSPGTFSPLRLSQCTLTTTNLNDNTTPEEVSSPVTERRTSVQVVSEMYSSELTQIEIPNLSSTPPPLRRAHWFRSSLTCFTQQDPEYSKAPHLVKSGTRRKLSVPLALPTTHKLVPLPNSPRIAKLKFVDENLVSHGNLVSCQGSSTYPMLNENQRAGDPLCDYFSVDVFDRAIIVSICDGCNWGDAPRQAAAKASRAFNVAISQRLSKLNSGKKAASSLLRGVASAHRAVVANPVQKFVNGTTTLLGAILLPVSFVRPRSTRRSDVDNVFNPLSHVLYVASIGDCKAFVWSQNSRTVKDITYSNRDSVLNASDCGGRIGAYLDGLPDLRNLRLYSCLCEEDDIVIVASDGVYDNCDPQMLGLTPREIGVDANEWSDGVENNNEEMNRAKTMFREKALAKIIESEKEDVTISDLLREETTRESGPGEISPDSVVKKIMEFCRAVTKSSRLFMEQNPDQCLPEDYRSFPGKMDHTSLAAFRVRSSNRISSAATT